MDTPTRIVQEIARRGYNAEREAVTLLARTPDPEAVLEKAIQVVADDSLIVSASDVQAVLDERGPRENEQSGILTTSLDSPVETKGSLEDGQVPYQVSVSSNTGQAAITIANDITDQSTGTGVYQDFVAVFRDRYERLSRLLKSRVSHRPTNTVDSLAGGGEASIIGMVTDIRSTTNGHWLIELEDTAGTFPCLLTNDKDISDLVDQLLLDEVIAVKGRLSSDGGMLFIDELHFPEIPRTFQPTTADHHVQAALISDLHIGSQEFLADAWIQFTDWLRSPEAESIEYLLIAGDLVEGVGVYPGQDQELAIIDIFEQYRTFSERLKAVPGDIEIVIIPGNHDAVRLAEPQPAFDAELREILSAHNARVTGNPSVVTIEGVSFLMYHGVSLDELIAELPALTYDEPHTAMYQLLKKRHLAPQFGERTRLAPEERDYLVIDEPPDVFHAGHVHKLGYGRYHNVTVINSGCWQAQTAFQRRVDIMPDTGFAPIIDLDSLEVTIRQFT